jgi:hypothetical protein
MFMNVELLNKVKEQILKEPAQFEMFNWYATELVGFPTVKIPNCGTAACIAGWAISLSKNECPRRASNRKDYYEQAREVLDLTPFQADCLFLGHRWPSELWHTYKTAKTLKNRAEIAAKRIDLLIAVITGSL